MTTPQIVEEPQDGESSEEAELQPVTEPVEVEEGEQNGQTATDAAAALDPEDVEVAEAEITEDDFDTGLFAGTEDRESTDDNASAPDSEPDFDAYAERPADAVAGLEGASSETIEDAINEGAARLSVVGLDDTEKDELEAELMDVFEAFRLGFFGARAVEEHVLADQEDVDPLWGLAGSMLVCGAFALHMRPDGAEQLASMKETLGMGQEGSA